jgi:ribosomal-protein-alanine N-acetyltransferase
MRLDDVPQVAAIEAASFVLPWTAESLAAEVSDNALARYFCLEMDGQVCAYMGVWLIFEEAHVTNVAVREDCRRQGWGEFLFRRVIAEIIPLGICKMTLEVRESNGAARGLYQKLGFKAEGVRPGYYNDNREDAIIMWADLAPQP